MPPYQADGSKLAGVIARAGAQRQHERTATREGFDPSGAAAKVYIIGLNGQKKEPGTNDGITNKQLMQQRPTGRDFIHGAAQERYFVSGSGGSACAQRSVENAALMRVSEVPLRIY